jgi:hypothetical protein
MLDNFRSVVLTGRRIDRRDGTLGRDLPRHRPVFVAPLVI